MGRSKKEEEILNWFQHFIDIGKTVFTIIDKDGITKFDSPNAVRQYGWTREEKMGAPITENIHPEDIQIALEGINDLVVNGKKKSTLKIRYKHKDGSYILLDVEALNELDNPLINGIIVASEDITKRKAMEDQLVENEKKYRRIFETLPDSYYRTDADSVIVDVNPSSEDVAGYSRDELIGMNVGDFFYNPDDRTVFLEVLRNDGYVKDYDLVLKNKKGDPYNASLSAHFIKDDNDEVIGLEGVVRDITERHQMMEQIRRSQEKYSDLVQHAKTGIFEFDLSTRKIVEINDMMLEYLGYSREEVLRMNTFDFLTGDSRNKATERVMKVIGGEEVSTSMEYEYITKGGEQRWVIISTKIHEEGGNPSSMSIIAQDITDRILMENRLKESEAKYRMILEQSPNNIFLVDMESKMIIESNPAFRRMIGYTEEEIKQMTLYEFIAHEKEDVDENGLKAIEEGTIHIGERQYVTKSGEHVLVEATLSIIEYQNRSVFCVTSWDITDRKKAQEVLENMNRDLDSRIKERTLELEEMNRELKHEILERRKAEEEITNLWDYQNRVIDSASEIIISINEVNKVTTWNRTIEQISGYNRKDVVGRKIQTHDAFKDCMGTLEGLKKECIERGIADIMECTLTTRNGNRRIISGKCSPIKGDGDSYKGLLIIANDITYRKDLHGKLLEGHSYLIPDSTRKGSRMIFHGLLSPDRTGLLISRDGSGDDLDLKEGVEILRLSERGARGNDAVTDMNGMIDHIEDHCRKNEGSVILLDRIDYLIMNNSFDDVTRSLYRINDLVRRYGVIFLLYINPDIMGSNQFAILNEEFEIVPTQRIKDIQLTEDQYDLLKFIHSETGSNSIVTYSRINRHLSCDNKTTSSKVRTLEGLELVSITKEGRNKIVNITIKGENLLSRRGVI